MEEGAGESGERGGFGNRGALGEGEVVEVNDRSVLADGGEDHRVRPHAGVGEVGVDRIDLGAEDAGAA